MSKRYTVKQLASLSGVSVRTLHHYDQTGLLCPAFLGDNGYRYYTSAELLRLQQILLHREFGLSLKEIGDLLGRETGSKVEQLEAQRRKLLALSERYRLLVETIDRTIVSLTTSGELNMDHQDLYKGFSQAKQEAYESEITSAYGSDAVFLSKQARARMSPAQQQAMMDQLAEIELGMAHLMREGVEPDDERVAPLVKRHREWVTGMWGRDCTGEAHAVLAEMYGSHPDFEKRFESIAPGMTRFIVDAIKHHTINL